MALTDKFETPSQVKDLAEELKLPRRVVLDWLKRHSDDDDQPDIVMRSVAAAPFKLLTAITCCLMH